MRTSITPELLLYLKNEGYTMLIANASMDKGNILYLPVKWHVDKFTSGSFNHSYQKHEIIVIQQALEFPIEKFADYIVYL